MTIVMMLFVTNRGKIQGNLGQYRETRIAKFCDFAEFLLRNPNIQVT
jgi:hypothetical protein